MQQNHLALHQYNPENQISSKGSPAFMTVGHKVMCSVVQYHIQSGR